MENLSASSEVFCVFLRLSKFSNLFLSILRKSDFFLFYYLRKKEKLQAISLNRSGNKAFI